MERKEKEGLPANNQGNGIICDIGDEIKVREGMNKEIIGLLKQQLGNSSSKIGALCTMSALDDINQTINGISKLQLGVEFIWTIYYNIYHIYN